MQNKSSSFARSKQRAKVMSDRRGKKLADFFPLYFNILKVVEKRGM